MALYFLFGPRRKNSGALKKLFKLFIKFIFYLIVGRANRRICRIERIFQDGGNAKVANFKAAAASAEKHIGGFDIPMNYAPAVYVLFTMVLIN